MVELFAVRCGETKPVARAGNSRRETALQMALKVEDQIEVAGADLGSTAHEICASGHARRMRPSRGNARTTSPIAPSRTISTRRGAVVICGAMASAADIRSWSRV